VTKRSRERQGRSIQFKKSAPELAHEFDEFCRIDGLCQMRIKTCVESIPLIAVFRKTSYSD